MQDWITYLIPVLVLTLVVIAWGAVQFLAKKMNVKNHIDHGGCCGACDQKESCQKASG